MEVLRAMLIQASSAGPFHFTQLLMPALLAAARNSDNKSRVVFASSVVLSKGINFDSLEDTPARKKVCADQRYGQSKLVRIKFFSSLVALVD